MNESVLAGRAIYNRARRLAFPRYPGTDGDGRAIEIVRSWFEVEGLEVAEERFSYDVRPAFRALRALLLSSAVVVAAAAILGQERPALALALLVLVWVAGAVFLGWAPWLERIYRHDGPTHTANVVGVRRGNEAEGSPPRMTLIILAHHDSKSQNLTLPFRAAFTGGALLGSVALGALEVASLAGGAIPSLWMLLSAGAACLSLVALSTLRSGNRSPGGVDNAGSVAIVAELARVVPRETPEDVELVFLSPGAEEDHMVGAMRWLDRHTDTLSGRTVFAINLDGAGIPGPAVLLERYGFGRKFSAPLSRVARQAAADLDLPVRGTLLPPAMGVDAIPFIHCGIDCLTLASGSLCPAVAAVHSHRDHGENLDPEALENVARLAQAMIRRLVDAEAKAD